MTQTRHENCIRVLIVEDNRDICENIADYLEARGHIADFAHDGIGAMHLALTEPIDGIVLDLMLPSMDGLMRVGDLTLDKQTLEIRRGHQKLSLNPACLKILERLMEASPAVVLRASLENLLWGDERPDSDALRSHLYKLRQAIDRPFDRPLLHTVHRIGYRLAESDDHVPR